MILDYAKDMGTLVRVGAAGALGGITLLWLAPLEPVLFQVGTVLLTSSLVPFAAGFKVRGGALLGFLFGLVWIAAKLGLTDFISRENILNQANAISVLAMIAVGVLSGAIFDEHHDASVNGDSKTASGHAGLASDAPVSRVSVAADPGSEIKEVLQSNREWMDGWDRKHEPWVSFDLHVKQLLRGLCGAREIRCYRMNEAQELQVLNGLASDEEKRLRDVSGIVHHVLVTGQRFVLSDPKNGQQVLELAKEDGPAYAAVLPVRLQGAVIGLVTVKNFDPWVGGDGNLELAADLVEDLWGHVYEGEALRFALLIDRASGVLDRAEFLTLMNDTVEECYENHEPVVILSVVVEGIRRLDDSGCWQARDEVIETIGLAMRSRLRRDDVVGRFSDERFVAVLRRLDVRLAELIARKLVSGVEEQIRCAAPEHPLVLRVSLSGSGMERIPPKDLLVQAFDLLSDARSQDKNLISREALMPEEVGKG